MSSIPGLFLEDFIAWNFDFVIEENHDPNQSLAIAEILGNISERPRFSKIDIQSLIFMFEPYRASVEDLLLDYDEESTSWRSYSAIVSDAIPDIVFEEASAWLKKRKEGDRHG